MAENTDPPNLTPAEQAIITDPTAGKGGIVPPSEHRFVPGDPRINRAGRRTAGATIKEHLNALADAELTEEQVRAVARDKRNSLPRRAAAERLLRMIEAPDMADFDPILDGDMSITQLKESGVNTELLKKCKTKVRTYKEGERDVVEKERDIELHDRAGQDFERVVDYSDGRPSQELRHHVDSKLRTVPEGINEAAELLSEITRGFGTQPSPAATGSRPPEVVPDRTA